MNDTTRTTAPAAPTRSATTRYLIRFGIAIALYLLIIIPAGLLVDSLGRTVLWVSGALALVPIALIVRAVVLNYRESDEFERTKLGESVAIAFAITAPVLGAVGLFQYAGLPPLNWVWAFVIAMVSWIIGSVVSALRYR